MKTKKFDCVAMKRAAQEAIRAKVRGMSRSEEVQFFRTGAEEFERHLDAARQKRSQTRESR
ncbi:MAG TPA: hypothetical protein VMY37_35020 [Thermoguttaceae bacterium]|nr:hypothetical protein [Thermoguttaceae bacterium]